MTKLERQVNFARLEKLTTTWFAMNESQLLAESQKILPNITAASKDESLRFLILDYCKKAFVS